jgi:transposase
MRKGYSKDLREKALKFLETHTYKETEEAFEVSHTTLSRWKKFMQEGDVYPIRIDKRKSKKLNHDEIIDYVIKNPDAYLYELADNFKCSTSSIFHILIKYGFKRKKRVYIPRS